MNYWQPIIVVTVLAAYMLLIGNKKRTFSKIELKTMPSNRLRGVAGFNLGVAALLIIANASYVIPELIGYQSNGDGSDIFALFILVIIYLVFAIGATPFYIKHLRNIPTGATGNLMIKIALAINVIVPVTGIIFYLTDNLYLN